MHIYLLLTDCRYRALRRNLMGEIRMSDEHTQTIKIHCAPNGRFYVRRHGEVICLPSGGLRYFESERDAWSYLADCDRAEIDRFAA
jgi:hypothetical protein